MSNSKLNYKIPKDQPTFKVNLTIFLFNKHMNKNILHFVNKEYCTTITTQKINVYNIYFFIFTQMLKNLLVVHKYY